MDLTNIVDVNAPLGEVWTALQDLERLAPCMPGAQLTEVDGDDFKGLVKIKVGPITAKYSGVARFLEVDQANHRVFLEAEGRDSRGSGNASATITASLVSLEPSTTRATVETDLTITGKVAQFGRGAITDVSGALMAQFASNLEEMLESDNNPSASTNTSPRSQRPEPEPVDLLSMVGPSKRDRVVITATVVLGLLVLRRLLTR